MNELKPCPFCGGKAELYTTITSSVPKRGMAWVHCVKCHSSGAVFEDRNNDGEFVCLAIKAWNRRADQGQANKVAELELVKLERDAAVEDLNALRKKTGWKCDCCYYNDNYDRDVCGGCDYNNGNNWQWRGLQEG